jgi:peptidylprolyl isomerase
VIGTSSRRATAAATVLFLGLGLLGCSQSDGGGAIATPSEPETAGPSAVPSSSAPAVQGEFCDGELAGLSYVTDDSGIPSLVFAEPITVTTDQFCVIREGDEGEAFQVGDYISFHSVEYSGDGDVTYSTFQEGSAQTGQIQAEDIGDPISNELVGHKAGTILVAAMTSSDQSYIILFLLQGVTEAPAATSSAAPVTETRAWGTPNKEVNPDIPPVTLSDTGEPSITPLKGNPPTKLVAQDLLIGDGAKVTEDQTVTVQYTGWLWDGTVFDSSWATGEPVSFPLTGVISGWTQGLAGHTVGSQVELVIPPDMGYGDSDNGSIPGGSTLVFVVDILGAS